MEREHAKGMTPSDAEITAVNGLQAVENTEFDAMQVATFQYDASYLGPFAALITWESPDGVPHVSTGTVNYSDGSAPFPAATRITSSRARTG